MAEVEIVRMRDLVYTCVFGNYDWVLPPIGSKQSTHHLLVTDRDGPAPAGWDRLVVDPADRGGPTAANRYWKMLGHVEIPGFERSLYVDANIRLLGDSAAFLDLALPPGAAMGLFRHPLRKCVAEEMEACISSDKIIDPVRLEEELNMYRRVGFPDDVGLSENGIIARRPGARGLDAAMYDWWELYHRFANRDQFSLPVVRWRHNLPVHWIDWSFRAPNPWFAIYAHRKGRGVNQRFAYMQARAHDSFMHAAFLHGWKTFRTIRRRFRPNDAARSLLQ